MNDREGPSQTVTYHCAGCRYLTTKDWTFYGENDDIDRGTDATCGKLDRHIESYYHANLSKTPDWCSFLKKVQEDTKKD